MSASVFNATHTPLDDAARRKVNYRPIDDHYDRVIYGHAEVRVDGERVIAIEPVPTEAERLCAGFRAIPQWDGTGKSSGRTLGLRSTHRVFGFRPRLAVRKDFCTTCRIARELPELTFQVYKWAGYCSRRLAEWMPRVHEEQSAWLDDNVLPVWRIPESVYTSGIINKTSALGYHRDQGNHPGSWSSMIVFQRDIEGGLLVMPELRLAFDFSEPSLIQFDGMRILHGVTAIRAKTPTAYRYSIVWYCREQMKACLEPDEELRRIRRKQTERTTARATLTRDELIDRLGVKKWAPDKAP